jgi:hypothetical protein
MSDTILPFQEWPEGIAQASVPANENSLRNEALRRPCLGISNNVTSPADGDLYIVGDAPTGNFSTFNENDLAFARVTVDGTSWYAWSPTDGLRVWMDDGSQKVYVGESTADWQDVTSGAGDVVGPASAVADRIALFDGTSGKLLKDGGKTIAEVRLIEQNSQNTAYTLVLADAGKHILHPSADTTARTFTIPANSSVAYPIGTAITFVNQDSAGVVTIAITSDTMRLAGTGSTGSRTLAANGVATALKITSTEWIVSGTGLT